VDIFALGCIMAELYRSKPLFNGKSEIDQLYKMCAQLGTPTQQTWSDGYRLGMKIGFNFPQFEPQPLSNVITNASIHAIDLMQKMLKWDAHKRPSASQILQHPYFRGFQIPEAVGKIP
jgi:serine/threonine protein kinase